MNQNNCNLFKKSPQDHYGYVKKSNRISLEKHFHNGHKKKVCSTSHAQLKTISSEQVQKVTNRKNHDPVGFTNMQPTPASFNLAFEKDNDKSKKVNQRLTVSKKLKVKKQLKKNEKVSSRLKYESYRKKQVELQPEKCCLVSVKRTKNNTHCSISSLFGNQKTLWNISGGQINRAKANGRRKTRYTQRMIFKATTNKLLGLGLKYLAIHCYGTTSSKRYVFKNFYRRFKIILLKDFNAIPHNGCRPRSARRL